MKTIFVLWHDSSTEWDDGEHRLVGAFSSYAEATDALRRVHGQPGFRDTPGGLSRFEVVPYQVDRVRWPDGFDIRCLRNEPTDPSTQLQPTPLEDASPGEFLRGPRLCSTDQSGDLETVDAARLKLDRPTAGWLPIRLRVGAFKMSVRASNLFNDPVVEIIDCAAFLESGYTGFRRVCFDLETELFALDLVAYPHLDKINRIALYLRWAYCLPPPMAGDAMASVYRASVPRQVLYRALLTGLEEWLDDCATVSDYRWCLGVNGYRRLIETRTTLGRDAGFELDETFFDRFE